MRLSLGAVPASGGVGLSLSLMTSEDAQWALATAQAAIEGTRRISEEGRLPLFEL